jgi:hypothetical protein
MQFADLDLTKNYSYADYCQWKFQERLELIKGKIFKMSPAPSSIHQSISREISGELWLLGNNLLSCTIKQIAVFLANLIALNVLNTSARGKASMSLK